MSSTHETHSTTPWDAFTAPLATDDAAHGDEPTFDTETLIAYHRGRLGAADTARLQRQLATSPTLVAELLDLEAFAAPTAADRAPLSPEALDDAWNTFEGRIDEHRVDDHDAAPAPVIDFGAARRTSRVSQPRTHRRWWIAAAAAVLAVVGWRTAGPFDTLTPPTPDASGVFVASFENGHVDNEWTLNTSGTAAAPRTLLEASFEDRVIGPEWTLSAPTETESSRVSEPLLHDDFEPEAGELNGWQVVGPANLEA